MTQQEFSPVATTEDVGIVVEQPSGEGSRKRNVQNSSNFMKSAVGSFKASIKQTKQDTKEFAQEVRTECFEILEVYESVNFVRENWYKFIFIPYMPAFHKPGWLLRYAVGPHNWELFSCFFSDFWAGITVSLTLIPQALSYAQLANLPPIHGLYTAVLPAAFYTFFGSSMQLCVGPVALVSLLMANLINKYNIDYVNNPDEAVDFAGEAAIAVGLILTVMSLLNLGHLIRFISHPVMSGFTTAAAMTIGINQLKSAFGFTVPVPQAGQTGYEYNYEVMHWFIQNWNGHNAFTAKQLASSKLYVEGDGLSFRNPFAAKICFGLYIPLLTVAILRNTIKATPERKKQMWFHVWNIGTALMPFAAIIIGAHVAWQIKHDDGYNRDPKVYDHDWYSYKLSILGIVQPGLNFIRLPSMKWNFGHLLGDVFPTALIAFMESYSVAHRIATTRNELHILNASQELWAVGVSNFLAGVSSSYPVAGSFSRSSLNATAGARTPLSKAINMIVVIFALQFLTRTFQYIPNAALAAVIWVAIYSLISFEDFWHAWKHSKKDFFIMLVTTVIVFVFDTGVGLAVGLGTSLLVFLVDTSFNPENGPTLIDHDDELFQTGRIHHILLRGDINFLTAGRTIDLVTSLTLSKPVPPSIDSSTINDRIFYYVSTTFDRFLKPQLSNGVETLPKALILDFVHVHVIDVTGLLTIEELAKNARQKNIAFMVINTTTSIARSLTKFGYQNDELYHVIPFHLAAKYHLAAGDMIPIEALVEKRSAESNSQSAVNANTHQHLIQDVPYHDEELGGEHAGDVISGEDDDDNNKAVEERGNESTISDVYPHNQEQIVEMVPTSTATNTKSSSSLSSPAVASSPTKTSEETSHNNNSNIPEENV